MPLQNRVTPFSRIEAVAARGLFTGNRGCLHDDQHRLVSQGWRSSRWIVCALNYKGIRRELMQPRRWTELFFLDEAVAFAAGHRPCALCRAAAFHAYMDAWAETTGQPPRVPYLDAALHQERLSRLRGEFHRRKPLGDLPDGAFVTLPEQPNHAWLRLGDRLLLWSHTGYCRSERWSGTRVVEVLTPPSTLAVLRAGYRPVLHPSVETVG